MRAVLLSLAIALAPLAGWAAPPGDAITGLWLNAEKTGYLQIYRTADGDYAGRVVGATDGEVRNDTENPDPAERGKSLLGQEIMHGFRYNGEGRWEQGRIYDPENGKTYDAWIELISPDQLELHGYIWLSVIGRSVTLTRVEGMPDNVVEKVLAPSPADAQAD